MKKYITYLLALIVLSSSCKDSKTFQTPCTGKINEVLVVANKTIWDSNVGDTIKHAFGQPVYGLPQDEPLFDVLSIPNSAFGSQFKSHRNIIEIKFSTNTIKAKIFTKNNYLAKDQVYIRIVAKDNQQFIELFEKNKNNIISIFKKAERERLKKYYSKYPDSKVFNKLKSKYGYLLSVPAGYNINKDTMGFVWLSSETSKISQGIFMYSYPYTDQSQFTKEAIITKRNEMLKKYIPGPLKGSYMKTYEEMPVVCSKYEHGKSYAIESRGMWNVEGDFMAGPFVNLSILDEKNQRIICVDGYVYAPNDEKRDYMFQVEAIMHSLIFNANKEK